MLRAEINLDILFIPFYFLSVIKEMFYLSEAKGPTGEDVDCCPHCDEWGPRHKHIPLFTIAFIICINNFF
jgi:hypothetical protein